MFNIEPIDWLGQKAKADSSTKEMRIQMGAYSVSTLYIAPSSTCHRCNYICCRPCCGPLKVEHLELKVADSLAPGVTAEIDGLIASKSDTATAPKNNGVWNLPHITSIQPGATFRYQRTCGGH